MKVSLNLQDDHHHCKSPLLKAKLPISFCNQPFTSIFATAINSLTDLSISLSTNFPSGPSLRFTYLPSPSTTTPVSPFSLSLKSGLGLFGSPHHSPLVFSAHFSLSNTTIVPTFFLHFKPQLGHFSLHKITKPSPDVSSEPHLDSGSPSNSEFVNAFAPDGPLGWQELKLEAYNGKDKEGFANPSTNNVDTEDNGVGLLSDRQLMWSDRKKGRFLSGYGVKARTVLPLTKSFVVSMRWGVNLPGDLGGKMPYLTVNKIGIEKAGKEKEKSKESNVDDLELLNRICFWMRRDLELLDKENRGMIQSLQDLILAVSAKNLQRESSGMVKKVVPASSDNIGEFEQRRRKKNDGQGNSIKELKKSANGMPALESELQKAIKAASS